MRIDHAILDKSDNYGKMLWTRHSIIQKYSWANIGYLFYYFYSLRNSKLEFEAYLAWQSLITNELLDSP